MNFSLNLAVSILVNNNFRLQVYITYLSSIITPFIKIQSVILVFEFIVHREPILLLLMDVFSIILVFGPTKHVSLSN